MAERPFSSHAEAEPTMEEVPGERPQRSTRGKGGARAQLAAAADRIRPDLIQGVKRSRTKQIPSDLPVNTMAPGAKKQRGVQIPLLHATLTTNAILFFQKKATIPFKYQPEKEDSPLNLNIPKPSFANANSRSAFGFQGTMAVPTDHQDNSDDDMYADAKEGADEIEEGGLGAMNEDIDIGNYSFSRFQCAHILYQIPSFPRTMYQKMEILVRPNQKKINIPILISSSH